MIKIYQDLIPKITGGHIESASKIIALKESENKNKGEKKKKKIQKNYIQKRILKKGRWPV